MPASHQIDYWTPLECRSAISMKVSDTVLRWGNEVNQLNEVLKFELFCMKHYALCTFPRTLSLSMLLVTQIYSANPHLWCFSWFCSRSPSVHSLHLPHSAVSLLHPLVLITSMLTTHNFSYLSPMEFSYVTEIL